MRGVAGQDYLSSVGDRPPGVTTLCCGRGGTAGTDAGLVVLYFFYMSSWMSSYLWLDPAITAPNMVNLHLWYCGQGWSVRAMLSMDWSGRSR